MYESSATSVDVASWQRQLAALSGAPTSELDDAGRIDLIRSLEELKSGIAAAQAELAVQFRDSQLDAFDATCTASSAKVRERKRAEVARSVCSQVALARRESPVAGNRHVGVALALREMPHTAAGLRSGRISEWRATLLVRETACLSVEDRRTVDDILAADTGRCEGWGNRRLVNEAKRIAAELDAESVARRARKAVADRRVSIRPAPDTMGYLTALLPVAQAVSVYAALKKHADSLRGAGDPRGRGQIMADTLFERITGRPAESPVPVSLNLVMTSRALLDPRSEDGGQEPAWLDGYGIVPAGWAGDHVWGACADKRSALWVRRLFTHPASGQLVAMDSRSRTAPAGLAAFLTLRDQTCRSPYCDAPIRHLDHVTAHVESGQTSGDDMQGLCEACNYTKQAPGWRSRARHRPGSPHEVVVTTPTGHSYRSTAPPLPGTSVEPSTSSPTPKVDALWRVPVEHQPAA